MSEFEDNSHNQSQILNLTLDGFEGPIDLLLNLVKEQKIDLTKIQILPLAEQYLVFLKNIIKEDIEIAAEYLVIGSVLAYIKSKLLLPKDDAEIEDPEILAELLRLQMLKLQTFQKLSKNLFSRKQLGKNFFSKGMDEIFSKKIKYRYNLNLCDLTKTYSQVVMKDKIKTMKISESKLCTVEKALSYLKNIIYDLDNWKELKNFIPSRFESYLEYKSAYAAYFVQV